MIKKLYSLLLFGFVFLIGSFCSAQFTSSVQLSDCTSSNVCSYSDLSNIITDDDPLVRFYFKSSSSSSSLSNCRLPISSRTNNTYNGIKQYISDYCGYTVFSVSYFICEANCIGIVNYSSSSMPLSSLSPVISGLINSVDEFIPYFVYVGIGILSALIGFVAIKRLINWLRGKILSPFK